MTDKRLSEIHDEIRHLRELVKRLEADKARMNWLQDYLGEFTIYRTHPNMERGAILDADLRKWVDEARQETASYDAARKAGEER